MRRQFALSTKIPTVVLSICLVFGFFSWLLLSIQINHLAKHAVFSKGTSTLERLNESIVTPLFNSDTISVQVSLKKATQDPSIISASLFGVDQELITQSIRPKPDRLEAQIFTRNVELQNTQIGIITVVVNKNPSTKNISNPILTGSYYGSALLFNHLLEPSLCRSIFPTYSPL